VPVSKPWKLVSREVKPDDTFIDIGGARIGGGRRFVEEAVNLAVVPAIEEI
jgi:hypothetical protein